MMILPPLFLVPILSENGGKTEESDLANNIVVLSTILSVVLFVAYILIISALGMIWE